jgi:hypothetical protein
MQTNIKRIVQIMERACDCWWTFPELYGQCKSFSDGARLQKLLDRAERIQVVERAVDPLRFRLLPPPESADPSTPEWMAQLVAARAEDGTLSNNDRAYLRRERQRQERNLDDLEAQITDLGLSVDDMLEKEEEPAPTEDDAARLRTIRDSEESDAEEAEAEEVRGKAQTRSAVAERTRSLFRNRRR